MTDGIEASDLSESVKELKAKLQTMKRLIENEEVNEEWVPERRKVTNCRASLIDGNFLSIVFMIVLILIISVTIYAFFTLFSAIRRKYPAKHSEL